MQFSAGQLIPMTLIDISDRVRPVSEDWAQALAANFEEHGIKTAIMLRPTENGRFRLVIGAHRHRGAQILGWEEIPAFVVEMSDDEALIAEIDENVMRHELTKLDRSISLLQRKEAHERLHPETAHGKNRKRELQNSATLPSRFTAEVAEKIGLGERTVQNLIQIAKKLDPEAVENLRGTPWEDNESALLKLANETPARQRNLTTQIANGARSLDEARTRAGYQDAPLPEDADPQGRVLANLMLAWVKAEPRTRERFLAEIKLAEDAAARRAEETASRKGRRA